MLNGLDGARITEVLKTLVPRDSQELGLLRAVIATAQEIQRRAFSELSAPAGLGDLMAVSTAAQSRGPQNVAEFRQLVASLPQEALRYFHGLIEAIDVYCSIHRQPIPVQRLAVGDPSMGELRRIRDMVLDEGLRSIY